jgi:hypothetical protein
MPSKFVITYGELDPRLCELHGGEATRFGTLIDPNGHKWIICATCINGLWDATNWAIIREEAESEAEQKLAAKFAQMMMKGGE